MFAPPDDYVAVSVLFEHTSTVTRKDVHSCSTPPSRVFRIAGAVVWKLTLGSTVCGEMGSLLPFLCLLPFLLPCCANRFKNCCYDNEAF